MNEAVQPHWPVVGIGASAGGIEAFQSFFKNMPVDSGLGFIVVLHLPADRKSILSEILGRWTTMPVVVAEHDCLVEPNTVYLPPSGVAVTYGKGRLQLYPVAADQPRDPSPITMLFNSLAAELNEDAIGIVLSGTGNDGALGLKAIKGVGGLTLAQGSEGTGPQQGGMPASAIATGAVDIVAPVEAMPAKILAIQRARQHANGLAVPTDQQIRASRLAICKILKRQLGHDFSGYKDKTFLRRVQRRMQVLNLASLDAFIERLERDRDEVVSLFRDLLIGVTSFFRDEDTFNELKKTVVPKLFSGQDANATIRVWIPGCATGEEAYSLAMLLLEYACEHDGPTPKIQVFATDIDEPAIMTARNGRYPSTLLHGLSPERLARFFVHGIDGSYTVSREVRELCTFSTHSLIRDPPFSRINLLSCRNLLIYLDIDQQSVVIPAFHYSLVPGGILLLGSAETINRHEELFSTVDRSHRIFQKRDVPSPALPVPRRDVMEPTPNKGRSPADGGPSRGVASKSINWANIRVLEQYAPAFAVVTAEGRSVQYSNRVTQYLELPAGVPSQDIFTMARKGLRAPLRALLKQAIETGLPVRKPGILMAIEGAQLHRVTLIVEPRREQGADPVYLIIFLGSDPADATARNESGEPDSVPETLSERELEAELRDTREQLQSIAEEHDTALEELKSSNEELHSVNEELQSTNEELETSKEEIQSINEELQTVNAQLATKVDELDSKNSDLKNLFESTQVATIFLDQYMIVRSFTPAVASIYNLIPSDQGRPITDIVSRLQYTTLREDCRQVLRTLQPLERRVARDDESTYYLMRVLPYRTPDSAVDGTIVTFADVTSIVQAEQHQRLLVDELNHRVRNMLTVVLAMATQTMRRSDSMEEFSEVYTGRVHALSAAYALLSSEGWQTVSIEDLVLEELKPFKNDDNVVIEGPLVLLEPQAALALGMAVHELTTNAVKYGALSTPGGTVAVRWHVELQRNGEHVVIEWGEAGGPPVKEPTRRGFGMTLIERGLRQDMSAHVELDFVTTGVQAKITAPIRGGHMSTPKNPG